MATARFAWGIDIGNRALKAIRLARVGDNLKVDDFDIIEHEQILSDAGDNRESYIQASLANFVQRHNLKGCVVSAGVSGQNSFARFIKLPPVEKKKIPEIVRFEAIQQIPFPLEDVEWSYQLFQTPASPDVEVGIFAMRKELVEHHLRNFADLDMKVVSVQMNPLAVYNAMQFDGRLGATTMIIDMGAENTDLIIADNDSVWLRSIPIGGNTFTETLAKAFKLNFAKAEELKRTAGTSKYTRQIFQAMRPVFGDLAGEIQRSMGFFSSVRRETQIKSVIALGATFRLPNLLRYLQQNLQLEAARMDSFQLGAPSDPKVAASFQENLLSLAGAYGLAIQGMGEGKIQSSLLPASIRRERMWKDKARWFGLAASLMVAGTGIAYGSMYFRTQAEASPLKETNDRILSAAKALDADWAAVEGSGSGDRDMMKKVQNLTDYRLLWTNLLLDIRGAVPVPQPAVAEGLAAWDAAKVKTVERGQRNLLVLDDLVTQYVQNLGPMLADADFRKYAGGSASAGATGATGGMGGMYPGMMGGMPPGMGGGYGMPPGMGGAASAAGAAGAAAPSADVRGFLVTAKCYTPNANGSKFVQEEFIKNLMKISFPKDPNRKYLVKRAEIVSVSPVANDSARLQQALTSYNVTHGDTSGVAKGVSGTGMPPGGMGMPPGMMSGMGGMPPGMMSGMGMPPGMMGGMGTPSSPYGMPSGMGMPGVRPGTGAPGTAEVKYLDPLTEEDITKDWVCTVLFAVVLDPPDSMVAAAAASTTQTTEPTTQTTEPTTK